MNCDALDELLPYYQLTAGEWSGLDATAKERLSVLARETLERWQLFQKSRQELVVKKRVAHDHPQRFESQVKILMREWRAGIYNTHLDAIVEALNVHEEELWTACHVACSPLIRLMCSKYQMTPDEAAVVLRQTLPIYKEPQKKAA